VGYEGVAADDFPADLSEARPVWEHMPGWEEPLTECRRISELPADCLRYVQRLEELTGVPVELVSVGPGRDQTIVHGDLFTR
jgi:adenylosuccinate synthase